MIWSGAAGRRKNGREPGDPTSPAGDRVDPGQGLPGSSDAPGTFLGPPVSRRRALVQARDMGIGGLFAAAGVAYGLTQGNDDPLSAGSLEPASAEPITGVKRFVGEFYGAQDSAVGVYPSRQGESNAGIDLANGRTNWRVESHSSGELRFRLSGHAEKATLSTDGDLVTQGYLYASSGLGLGHIPTARQPFGLNIDYDGSRLSDEGGDKVAAPLAVTFRGGFGKETSYPGRSPTFLFGANDYIITGSTLGDLDGITDLYSRLSETHLATPRASINMVRGLVGESHVDNTAAGATVSGWLISISAINPQNNADASVLHAASIMSMSPEPGTAEEQYNIFAAGSEVNRFDGKIRAAGGFEVTDGGAAGFHVFGVRTPNRQASGSGFWAGINDGLPGVELSNGQQAVRLDLKGATFRILQAGNDNSLLEVDAGGHVAHAGGIGLFGATPLRTRRPASTDATDLASVIALANDLKADLQAIGLKR